MNDLAKENYSGLIRAKGKEMEAIRVQHTIQKSGELTIRNLPIEQGQEVEILLLFTPTDTNKKKPKLTARQLRQSDLIGLWQERDDIEDSTLYARQLRAQAQTRPAIDELTNDYLG